MSGQALTVNSEAVQVFEFPDEAAASTAASAVSPTGSSIGTTMVSWLSAPHFYRAGRVIVIYVGTDQPTLDLLASVLGPQFAGR